MELIQLCIRLTIREGLYEYGPGANELMNKILNVSNVTRKIID